MFVFLRLRKDDLHGRQLYSPLHVRYNETSSRENKDSVQ